MYEYVSCSYRYPNKSNHNFANHTNCIVCQKRKLDEYYSNLLHVVGATFACKLCDIVLSTVVY